MRGCRVDFDLRAVTPPYVKAWRGASLASRASLAFPGQDCPGGWPVPGPRVRAFARSRHSIP